MRQAERPIVVMSQKEIETAVELSFVWCILALIDTRRMKTIINKVNRMLRFCEFTVEFH